MHYHADSGSSPTLEHAKTSRNLPVHAEPSASSHWNCTTRRHAFYDRPTTLQYLLEALETRGQQAGARENENRVENLPSGDPITCRIHRLASTPLPPTATAIINVHILSRQVHAVNVHVSGRQQVSDHPWPPTPTQLQQDLSTDPLSSVDSRRQTRFGKSNGHAIWGFFGRACLLNSPPLSIKRLPRVSFPSYH
ncbi:hypothetical protein Taro_019406 [Colocasia esculenta]|uniref:Uncharacterized protein n=1 Tax=Colocasia esculenta TaxID=4460 RepID=A0A843UTD6_COLES|nr:hypothetical protein [Colocasia esculenta]